MKPQQFGLHAAIETKHWWFRARRSIIVRLVQQLVPPSKDIKVVDFGCGTGGIISSLAEMYDCVGIDSSEEAINLAKSKFPDVSFFCGESIRSVEARLGKVDLFLLLDVLEHVEHDREFLEELLTLLTPGGHILMTVPADMSLWSPQDENYGHFRRYETQQLMDLWSGLPVNVIFLSYFNTYLYPLVKAIRMYTRLRGKEWGEANTDLVVPAKPLNRILEYIYSSEVKRLTEMISSGRSTGFPFGVSLIACISKDKNR